MAGVKSIVESTGKKMDPVVPDKNALQALIQQKYVAVLFEVPGYDVVVEVAMLKRSEREEIVAAVQRPDGTWDNLLQNRMAASFGLVNPRLSADELKEYPDSFINPIAEKVWSLSNDYMAQRKKEEEPGESRPFTKTSGSTIGQRTDSDISPAT